MASVVPDPPPTLVHMDAALVVDGPADATAAAAAAVRRVAIKGADSHIDDIVNSVLPPRVWSQDAGSTFLQYVSKEPASRLDVLSLQDQLETRLVERQARMDGICPVREDLYRQAFDELIRQVTINSPERGLLLLRVRDEIRMTIDAYKTLYDSSVTFGTRKQLQAEQGIPEMEQRIEELSERKRTLEAQVLALRNKIDMVERRQAERRGLDEKRRQEEIAYLKHQAKHLDLFLKSMPKS